MVLVDGKIALGNIPKRSADTHKGDYGRVLIFSGSKQYVGAPFFAAQAAVNAGSGLVYLTIPECIWSPLAQKLNEPIFLTYDSEFDALKTILNQRADVCLIGPGLGTEMRSVVRESIRSLSCPIVLDADGLNAIAKTPEILKEATAPLVLTPHPGEFARLFPKYDVSNRAECALKFANTYGVTLVLKGHRTLTATADGRLYENTSGNPGMAKGGSGDVLAGVIASLIGQGIAPDVAAYTGVWLHGYAGDLCKEKFGEYGMTPTDLLGSLKTALREC